MDYLKLFIEFIASLEWAWVLLAFLVLGILREIVTEIHDSNVLKLSSTIKLDNTAVEMLDSLISTTLEEYSILILEPKQITYIPIKLEEEILEYTKDKVSSKLSHLLLQKLAFIYNDEYIPTLIGDRIYLAVLDFVLAYNANNTDKK